MTTYSQTLYKVQKNKSCSEWWDALPSFDLILVHTYHTVKYSHWFQIYFWLENTILLVWWWNKNMDLMRGSEIVDRKILSPMLIYWYRLRLGFFLCYTSFKIQNVYPNWSVQLRPTTGTHNLIYTLIYQHNGPYANYASIYNVAKLMTNMFCLAAIGFSIK